MTIWTFNPDTCTFQPGRHDALAEADVAVVKDDTDVHVVRNHAAPRRWPTGEPLIVAGCEFEREQFE
jgi:hypothetical protein